MLKSIGIPAGFIARRYYHATTKTITGTDASCLSAHHPRYVGGAVAVRNIIANTAKRRLSCVRQPYSWIEGICLGRRRRRRSKNTPEEINQQLSSCLTTSSRALSSTTEASTGSSTAAVGGAGSSAAGAGGGLPPTYTSPQILQSEDGNRQYAMFDTRKHPKLKPSIVRRRLNRMRTYVGQEKNIRHSPWKLNLVCQFAAKLPLQEALTQLEFNKKWAAPLVQKVLRRTSNLADLRDGLQPSQLEVAECFATKGTPLKRIRPMGRGRMGRMEHKHSHMRVVLREIDFKLRIYQAPSVNQKKKWFLLQQQAERDGSRARAEREEIERLERQAAAAAGSKDE